MNLRREGPKAWAALGNKGTPNQKGAPAWKAGETRPAFALPLGSGEAGFVLTLAIAAAVNALASLNDPSWFGVAWIAGLLSIPLGPALATWSSREGWAGAAQAAKAFKRSLARAVFIDADVRDDLSSLTEIGAWRLARHRLLMGDAREAAEVWLACPFNPSWRARLDRKADGSFSLLNGRRMSFLEAIEASIEQGGDSEALRRAALAMRSAKDGQELAKVAYPAPTAIKGRPGL